MTLIETRDLETDPAIVPPPSRYVREVVVERQIAGLIALPVATVLEAARAGEGEPESRVREEALVAICRHLSANGDNDGAWKIALVIAGRVKYKIAQSLRFWRLDRPESVAQDAVEEIMSGMYSAIFDTSPKSAFWEIRFWVAFDRRVLDTIRTMRIERDRTVELVIAGDDDGDDAVPVIDGLIDGAVSGVGSLDDPLTSALVAEALAALPQHVRTAYVLRVAANMPIDSLKDNQRMTISKVLGVSSRSVRGYLRRAERAVEDWRRGDGREDDR